MTHPSQRIRSSASMDLAGKRIILGIAGSIAAVKTVELARELIRHGAEVIPVMTPAATRILHPDALLFACGHQPITSLSGAVEHVSELGVDGDADLMLIAPATGNTIAKLALGIDDTALTTFAAVAIGAKRPLLVAPAMHGVMEDNPATRRHLDTLRAAGVHIVRPLYEEDKAKLAPVDEIVAEVRRALAPATWRHKRVLVVCGPARERIDPVRIITNLSSGKVGRALVGEAWRRGAQVTVLDASGSTHPVDVEVHRFESVSGLVGALDELVGRLRPHFVFVPAALSDYAPVASETKLASDEGAVNLHLEPVPKVLPHLARMAPDACIIGWKLEDTLDKAVERARAHLEAYGIDWMVANASSTLGADEQRCVFVSKDVEIPAEGAKAAVAHALLDTLEASFVG